MQLWRIVPSARPSDTRWEDHPVYAEVIVRAESAAMARLVAGRSLYRDNVKTQFGEERDPIFISAFNDEKLYRVSQLDAATTHHKAEGAREVVHAEGPVAGQQ
jgi:hypothetical protein